MRKHWQYLKYIIRHKWYVFLACRKLKVPLWQSIIHDWSKFLPNEWFAFVHYFHGNPKIGDIVMVNCIDGFGGKAKILKDDGDSGSKYFVRMLDEEMGEKQEFRAHDIEINNLNISLENFDQAWNRHQKRNKHHWQYWVLIYDDGSIHPLPMPDRYIREMVADWVGAGRAITGKIDVAYWYWKNQSSMKLSLVTRSKVQSLVKEFE